MTTKLAPFQWQCQPQAENYIVDFVNMCVKENPFIAELENSLFKNTSTRLLDWLDHIVMNGDPIAEQALDDAGFVAESAAQTYRVFSHPGAQLPRVVLNDQGGSFIGLALTVDLIADFLMVRGMSGWIEGSLLGGYRRCCVSTENTISLFVVERRGTLTMEPTYLDEKYPGIYLGAKEKWKTRPRDLDDEDEAMARTFLIAQELISDLGEDLAAWVILECEREYWESRNTAGQLQKNRQDRLGMGWANHDHHTFRSSRRHFAQLVRLFEMLGFHCRERYYTGKEAGWGAQIMENPRCQLVLFLDVDLSPEEIEVDFSHHPIPDLDNLGTIGLWCGLNGDSILKGGMHHLEAQFMFDDLTKDLETQGIKMMSPFSSFPYLKQAFTMGEIWPVKPERIKKLLEKHKITQELADKFLREGTLGSHLENLQRREGYKGFNQKNVSIIIKKTDPRNIQLAS